LAEERDDAVALKDPVQREKKRSADESPNCRGRPQHNPSEAGVLEEFEKRRKKGRKGRLGESRSRS